MYSATAWEKSGASVKPSARHSCVNQPPDSRNASLRVFDDEPCDPIDFREHALFDHEIVSPLPFSGSVPTIRTSGRPTRAGERGRETRMQTAPLCLLLITSAGVAGAQDGRSLTITVTAPTFAFASAIEMDPRLGVVVHVVLHQARRSAPSLSSHPARRRRSTWPASTLPGDGRAPSAERPLHQRSHTLHAETWRHRQTPVPAIRHPSFGAGTEPARFSPPMVGSPCSCSRNASIPRRR